MSAICVMKDIKPDKVNDPSGSGKKVPDYWGPSQKLLGDMTFLNSLKEFDRDNIAPHIMKKIRAEFMTNPEFDPVKVINDEFFIILLFQCEFTFLFLWGLKS